MTTVTFSEVGSPRPWIEKRAGAAKDYIFNWTDWLAQEGDAIASYEITVDGVTLDSHSRTGAFISAWISGGTVGDLATVTCRVTTDNSPARVETQPIYLKIR